MKGRKLNPTHLRIIKGNPSGRPLPENEPKPKVAKPRLPRGASARVKKHWVNISEVLLQYGLLTEMDHIAFRILCEYLAEYEECNEEINKRGRMVKGQKSTAVRHPLITVRNQAWDNVYRILGDFGMTPSSRARVKSSIDNGEDDDPWSKF